MIGKRLEKLEKCVDVDTITGRQFVGCFYDELSADERYLWLKYHNSLIAPQREVDVEAFEQVMGFFEEGLHFRCEDRQKPPTQQELRERVEEVGRLVDEMKTKYKAEMEE